jgi:methylmalonyl-CoA mutase
MADNTLQNLLNDTFPIPDSESWKKAASAEIDGADPLTSLLWPGEDEIKYAPFYDGSTAGLAYLRKFQLPADNDSFLGYRTWMNMPNISVTEELTANQIALDHLKNGADGVLFNLSKEHVDFNTLLTDIQWQYCDLSFQAKNEEQDWNKLNEFLSRHYSNVKVTGSFFRKALPKSNTQLIDAKDFHCLGMIIDSATPVKQIVEALTKGVQVTDLLSSSNKVEKIVNAISFSIPVSANFLQEISKLQALRMLWYQVARAYGIERYEPRQLHIHARSEQWVNEKYQPHGNMLKSTTAAMASIIGGCNALTVFAEDEQSKMMTRIARNVSNILREESHFNKVSDPVAGAYVIDRMVNDMATTAWAQFQTVIKKS